MERYLKEQLLVDLKRKIALLTGPRQVGKTTLAKSLFPDPLYQYFNWDFMDDRPLVLKKTWDRSSQLVIFDELHKMKNFKSWLKGIFDKEGVKPAILVTGSARLDIAKKMGDSLAGRFFPFHLYPLDLWELQGTDRPQNIYQKLSTCSGFPEPFLEGTENFYARWSKTHLDLILRQDLLDLESVKNISSIETLISLLQYRVGSTVSYSSLARDLGRDPKTIQSWLTLLENLFVIFKVTPYHKNIGRALLKEPKYYFYDLVRVKGEEGQKLENFMALSLKKQLDYLGEVYGMFGQLSFLRTRDGKEIDFIIHWEKSELTTVLLEVKLSDTHLSPHFSYFGQFFKKVKKIQLVKAIDQEKAYPDGSLIVPLLEWPQKIDFRRMAAIGP